MGYNPEILIVANNKFYCLFSPPCNSYHARTEYTYVYLIEILVKSYDTGFQDDICFPRVNGGPSSGFMSLELDRKSQGRGGGSKVQGVQADVWNKLNFAGLFIFG